jgi:copper chaperone
MAHVQLKITGMSCGHCVKAVERALDEVQGVQVRNVQVGSAEVTYDPQQASTDRLLEAIREEGYQVEVA